MAVGYTVPGNLPCSGRARSRGDESVLTYLAPPIAEAGVESTELGVRAGVDVSEYVDGAERVAHMAAGKLEGRRGRSGLVLDSVGAQLRMVVSLLRAARHWSGLRRDPAAVDDDHCNRGRVLLDFLSCRVAIDSVYRLDRVRVVFKLPNLAVELASLAAETLCQ